jgi:hypothetical protein
MFVTFDLGVVRQFVVRRNLTFFGSAYLRLQLLQFIHLVSGRLLAFFLGFFHIRKVGFIHFLVRFVGVCILLIQHSARFHGRVPRKDSFHVFIVTAARFFIHRPMAKTFGVFARGRRHSFSVRRTFFEILVLVFGM